MKDTLAVGVDLGATNVRIALGNNEGTILYRLKEPTSKDRGANGISEQIIRMIRSLQPGTRWIQRLRGIGLGATGPLDMKDGGLKKPTNLPYEFVPLVEPLKQAFGLPTSLLNDGLTAVMGEKFFGAGKPHENLAYITLSSGIGGGIYVNNHLLRGKDGNATEIGHFTIDMEGRLLCGCGRRGHWEAYCSGTGIPQYARLILKEHNPKTLKDSLLSKSVHGDWEKLTSKLIYDTAKMGDKLSQDIVERIGHLNAIGFACVVDAYDPSLITVGGSLPLNNRSLIIDPVRQHVERHARNRVPKIALTKLGDDVVLYGALALAFHPVI